MVRQINQNEFTKVINRDITTIVYFSMGVASQQQRTLDGAVEGVSKDWSDKEVEFVRLDIGNKIYKVEGAKDFKAPSFVAFINGEPVCELWKPLPSTIFGMRKKLRDKFESYVNDGLNEGFNLTDGKLEKSESLISDEKKEKYYNSFKSYLIAFLIFGSCVGVCFMPSSDNTTRTKPTNLSRQDCYDMYPSLASDDDAWDNPGLIACLAKIEARK